MALIRTKLRELRNADVKFISLVDRAASRIPFRVLKRDGESEMIDLTRIMKKETTTVGPTIAAVVVYTQKDDAVTTLVRKSITDAGFKTDKVQKSDDQTIVYRQLDGTSDLALVRLSDQMVVSVKDLDAPKGMFADIIQEHGFYPGMSMAVGILHDKMAEIVAKSDTITADLKPVIQDFYAYVDVLTSLPAAIFKADAAVNAAVPVDKEVEEKKPDVVGAKVPDVNVETKEVPGMKAGATSTEVKKKDCPTCDGSGAVGKNQQTKCPDCGGSGFDGVTGESSKKTEAAKKKDCATCKGSGKIKDGNVKCPDCQGSGYEDQDQDPGAGGNVTKADTQSILDAITSVRTELTGFISAVATKVDGVVTEQVNQKNILDGVVKKSEEVAAKLKGIVIAPPNNEDTVKDIVHAKKKDDDPRTGNFDTAFLGRGRMGSRR